MRKYKYLGQTVNDYFINRVIRTEGKQDQVECVCNICKEKKLASRMYINQLINNPSPNRMKCRYKDGSIKIGDVFGRLTVIGYPDHPEEFECTTYKCQCKCGNIVYKSNQALGSGNVNSCGCLHHDNAVAWQKASVEALKNESSQKLLNHIFGYLTVIREATTEEIKQTNKPQGHNYWMCKCKCGNTKIVSTNSLTNGSVSSCGCMTSKGEAKIANLLMDNRYTFKQQVEFSDLYHKTDMCRFDFGIYNNNTLLYLIEYDGIQHTNPMRQFGSTIEEKIQKFEINQSNDAKKNAYCKEHNIPLIRIPYTHYDNLSITDLDINTSNFIV